jgi:hypothetical protein
MPVEYSAEGEASVAENMKAEEGKYSAKKNGRKHGWL